jgi:hypothetical protein
MPQDRRSTSGRPATQKCCHHWVIGPAEGATSRGVCRLCGKEREFSNDMQICPDENGERQADNRRPVRQIKHRVRDGPTCEKCGKPMMLETWFGVGVKLFWLCDECNIRRHPFQV